MSERKSNLIKHIKTEAYITGEGDCRFYVNNRISRASFDAAVEAGIQRREDDLVVGKFPNLSSESAKSRALKSIGLEVLSGNLYSLCTSLRGLSRTSIDWVIWKGF